MPIPRPRDVVLPPPGNVGRSDTDQMPSTGMTSRTVPRRLIELVRAHVLNPATPAVSRPVAACLIGLVRAHADQERLLVQLTSGTEERNTALVREGGNGTNPRLE